MSLLSVLRSFSAGLSRFVPLALAFAMAACGGGSNSAAPAPAPTVGTCATDRAVIEVTAAPKAGQNVELLLRSCTAAPLAGFAWRQTAGGTVLNVLSAKSAGMSLELPQAAGAFGFEARYTDEMGVQRTANTTFTSAANPAGLLMRGDPSVWGYSTMSVRAWVPSLAASELTGARIAWAQLSGPALTLNDPANFVQIIQAPVVAMDTVARLAATVTLANGTQRTGEYSLLLQPPPAYATTTDALWGASAPVSPVYPYRAASPHAQALNRCVYNPSLAFFQACTVRELPLLGTQAQGQAPSIEQVMDRVLVSHDWMGEVFERYLREQDPFGDLRRQLASTTAVVIGARVRPAFYWVATGAIYLDAANLWLTPEQRDTLSEAPDPRSAFGADLAHASLWRYVKNNQSASVNPAISQRLSRPAEALLGSFTRLMYHELTHAADYTPPSRHLVLNPDGLVSQNARAWGSERLQTIPLQSQALTGIARVRFFGDASTAQQRAYTPQQIGELFAADVGTDFYSYAKSASAAYSLEDTAMLLEEALMQLRHGVLRDVAVTSPILTGQTSADVVVGWGQRGRVGDVRIRPRAQLGFNELMPWLGANFAGSLAAPIAMRAGASWLANLDPSVATPLEQGQSRPFSAPLPQDLMPASDAFAGLNAADAERIAHLRHLDEQTKLVLRMQRR